MNTRRHGRIVHYCNLLKLRSWDKKDVIDYLDAYFENPRSTNSMSLRKKILQLELDNIADSIIAYTQFQRHDFLGRVGEFMRNDEFAAADLESPFYFHAV